MHETVNKNADALKAAGYLKAAKIINTNALKLAKDKIPLMLKGYADTPIGKAAFEVLLANAVELAVRNGYLKNVPYAKEVSSAMLLSAAQTAIDTLDIEGLLESIFKDEKVIATIQQTDDRNY